MDAIEVCSNGVIVQHVDMAVEYSYMGNTLEIVGDWSEGEVSITEATAGYYVRSNDGIANVTLDDGRTFTLVSEEDY